MERFYKMVEASNKKFPRGVEPYQMATRLLEECGEVAVEINLWVHVKQELEESIQSSLKRSKEAGLIE